MEEPLNTVTTDGSKMPPSDDQLTIIIICAVIGGLLLLLLVVALNGFLLDHCGCFNKKEKKADKKPLNNNRASISTIAESHHHHGLHAAHDHHGHNCGNHYPMWLYNELAKNELKEQEQKNRHNHNLPNMSLKPVDAKHRLAVEHRHTDHFINEAFSNVYGEETPIIGQMHPHWNSLQPVRNDARPTWSNDISHYRGDELMRKEQRQLYFKQPSLPTVVPNAYSYHQDADQDTGQRFSNQPPTTSFPQQYPTGVESNDNFFYQKKELNRNFNTTEPSLPTVVSNAYSYHQDADQATDVRISNQPPTTSFPQRYPTGVESNDNFFYQKKELNRNFNTTEPSLPTVVPNAYSYHQDADQDTGQRFSNQPPTTSFPQQYPTGVESNDNFFYQKKELNRNFNTTEPSLPTVVSNAYSYHQDADQDTGQRISNQPPTTSFPQRHPTGVESNDNFFYQKKELNRNFNTTGEQTSVPAAKPTSRFQIVREHFENAVLDENFVSEHEKSKIVADDKEILVQPERNTSPVTVPFFKSKMLPMGKQEPTQKTLKISFADEIIPPVGVEEKKTTAANAMKGFDPMEFLQDKELEENQPDMRRKVALPKNLKVERLVEPKKTQNILYEHPKIEKQKRKQRMLEEKAREELEAKRNSKKILVNGANRQSKKERKKAQVEAPKGILMNADFVPSKNNEVLDSFLF